MTEKEYLLLEKAEEIPMDVWYNYYLERGGYPIGMTLFIEVFATVATGVMIITRAGKKKYVSFDSMLKQFYAYYRAKFSLTY